MKLRTLSGRGYALLSASLIAVTFAWFWPVLWSGFSVDDFAQISMMRGEFPVPRPPLQLFTFSNGGWLENVRLKTAGVWPWWSNPAFRLSLFRPLSSALMWLDLHCFGTNALDYHLHSALWWLFMMACLAALLHRLTTPACAILALALCAVHGSHIWFLGWIANRNAVIASAFALLGIGVMLRSAENPWRKRLVAMACFVVALCAGEYALGYLAYPLCYEVDSQRSWRARIGRALPWVAFTAVYLVVRAGLGFGSFGSGAYIDAFGEPLVFAKTALVRFPISVAELLFGVQASWWQAGFPWTFAWVDMGIWPRDWALELRPMQLAHEALGWIAVALSLWFVLARWRTSAQRWLLIATPLALIPSLPGTTETRLLFPCLVGWSVVMAEALREQATRAGARRIAAMLVVALLIACQLAGQVYFHQPRIRGMPLMARAVRRSILAPELAGPLRDANRVLLLGAADPTTTIYFSLVRRVYGQPMPPSYQLLSSHGGQQRLERISSHTFALERLDWRSSPFDSYAAIFNREPIRTGDSFDAGTLHAVVERAFDGRPIRTLFRLDVPLEAPNVLLLQQTARGLKPVSFPAIGASVLVEPPVPPFELAYAP